MRRITRIHNATRDRLIASDATLALTRRERRRGLLGRDSMDHGEALVFPRCRQVHTFGMRFPVDVLFTDARGKIVRACPRLRPSRLSAVAWRARAAIELPAGAIEQSGTATGDVVAIEVTGEPIKGP